MFMKIIQWVEMCNLDCSSEYSGAKKVFISSPTKDATMFVVGVNK